MKITEVIKNGAALGAGILLSCGASQLFGAYRLTADLYTTCKVNRKIKSLALFEAKLSQKEPLKLTKNEIKKICNRSKVIKQRLAAEDKASDGSLSLTRVQADSLIKDVKAIIERNKTKKAARLIPSLKADLFCFLPLIGAFAWRVRYNDWQSSPSRGLIRGLAYALERHGKMFAPLLFPLNGRTLSKQQTEHNQCIAKISPSFFRSLNCNTKKIEIEVKSPGAQTRMIEAYHVVWNEKDDRPTIVIFHGNGQVATDLLGSLGSSYVRLGYNVLIPTLGGYPGSGKVKTSEESLMRDTFAIQKFLKEQGVKQVVCHGVSLGGASAILFGTTSPLSIKAVIADQTFTTSYAAACRLINKLSYGLLGSIGDAVFRAAFPPGKLVHLDDGSTIATNGLDNLSRIDLLKDKSIPLAAIGTEYDFIMERKNKNFSDELYQKRYPQADGGLCLKIKNGYHAIDVFSTQEGNELKDFLMRL